MAAAASMATHAAWLRAAQHQNVGPAALLQATVGQQSSGEQLGMLPMQGTAR